MFTRTINIARYIHVFFKTSNIKTKTHIIKTNMLSAFINAQFRKLQSHPPFLCVIRFNTNWKYAFCLYQVWMSNDNHYQNHLIKIDHVLLCDHGCQLTYRQNLKDVGCPTKWRKGSIRQTLQVRVTSDTQKSQSYDWHKWRCSLWRNVNSHTIVGHRTSFQAICRCVSWWTFHWHKI